MLWRLYQRYDRIEEPLRFLLFMVFFIPAIVAATNPYSMAAAAIGWTFLIFVLVTRFWFVEVRPRLRRRR